MLFNTKAQTFPKFCNFNEKISFAKFLRRFSKSPEKNYSMKIVEDTFAIVSIILYILLILNHLTDKLQDMD